MRALGCLLPLAGAVARAEDADAFRFEPASIEAPRLRNAEPRTLLYIDGTYARSGDLSALPTIAGRAQGWRLALGGRWKRGRFQWDAEFPVLQATTLALIDPNPVFMIDPRDKNQTAFSLGDSRIGGQWTAPITVSDGAVVAGFGLGLRVPTHTTHFSFHLVNGAPGSYLLPYYFHLEPTLILGETFGRVTLVMNQGALIMLGPDGTIEGLPFTTPTLYFWEAHYALAVRVLDHVALSVEGNTTVQLNSIDKVMFPTLNHLRAAYLSPGIQVHTGRYRVDLIGRFGATPGAGPVGVINYAGTHSVTLRLTRAWD
ncbi:MAG TPA: hypothetical protein VHU40_17000 [Polyangia bacterium]|nr:hypothetical protein [Polyangia bacterium]